MATETPIWGLPLYDHTDTSELDVLLNGQSVKFEAALTVATDTSGVNQQFYGPAAARVGLTGVKPGDTYQETDAGKLTWRQNTAGLWRVFNTNGPIALTLNSGWTASQAATFEVRSGLLILNGRLGATSAAGTVAATLPPDYRPLAPRVMTFTDVTTIKDLIIGTDGALQQFGKGATVTTDMRLATISPFPVG